MQAGVELLVGGQALGQVTEVLLQGVAARSGELDGLRHRDAPVPTGELHDME